MSGALGLSAGGEYGDQPILLAGIMSCIENILRTAAMIPAEAIVHMSPEFNVLTAHNGGNSQSPPHHAQLRPGKTSHHGLELVSGNADLNIVTFFASTLIKLWPENAMVNGVTGAGHVQVCGFMGLWLYFLEEMC